jgi:hypothetical protein
LWVPYSFGSAISARIAGLFFGAVRLPFNDRFERRPFGLNSNMAVVAEHTLRDMTGNVHDGLIAGTAFR